MTLEQQIKALAELDGFVKHARWDYYYRNGDIDGKFVDDSKDFNQFEYRTSYDAIIPLVQKQPREVRCNMWNYLDAESDLWDATPAQLCEALLRATNKWKD